MKYHLNLGGIAWFGLVLYILFWGEPDLVDKLAMVREAWLATIR